MPVEVSSETMFDISESLHRECPGRLEKDHSVPQSSGPAMILRHEEKDDEATRAPSQSSELYKIARTFSTSLSATHKETDTKDGTYLVQVRNSLLLCSQRTSLGL